MMIRSLLLFILTLFVVCCSNQSDERLTQVSELSSASPRVALDSLNKINRKQLSERDRHYYDFLIVKVSDKNYMTHSSDSLILSVIQYELHHKENKRYTEALYYGGRVYSDMGDYPTALKYFQEALHAVNSKSNIHLRGNILSQIARLLNKLRLYEEAIPYIKEAIHIDSVENDSFNLAYDNQLIGSVYLHSKKIDKAKVYFRRALALASNLSKEDQLHMKIYLAACELENNSIDSALLVIRGIPESVSPNYRNLSLAYASDIYLKAGILDTAYKYAFELLHSTDPNNRKCGYSNILSGELIKRTHPDSIVRYIEEYKNLLEKYYDEHEVQQALIQNSFYNYQIHERERFNAEKSRSKIIIGCCLSLLSFLILAVVLLIYRIRTKQVIIKLHETIARLDSIEQLKSDDAVNNIRSVTPTTSDLQLLRMHLRQKIEQIGVDNQNESISNEIINSKSYSILQKYIEDKKFIKDTNPLWKELYDSIIKGSPNFENKLHLLIGGNIKQHEMQTIILIKCGVTPTQMSYLLGKTKGSISSRRESLGVKLLGEKYNLKAVDLVIRSL
jgi:tetratricopeptide (TPR) repeat protein